MGKLWFLAAAAAVVGGCGSDGSPTTARNARVDRSAARFVVRVQAELRRGRFEHAWRSLHPAQKRVVSAGRLASCYPRNAYPRRVAFRATEVRDVSWHVPGTAGLADAEEVTVTATSAGKAVDTFAQHIVRLDGGWRWMLSRAFFEKARRGAC